MTEKKSTVQLIWGTALLLVGILLFFRIPQIMPEIEKMDQFKQWLSFIRFCLYFLVISLVVGGGKKIFNYYSKEK